MKRNLGASVFCQIAGFISDINGRRYRIVRHDTLQFNYIIDVQLRENVPFHSAYSRWFLAQVIGDPDCFFSFNQKVCNGKFAFGQFSRS